MIHYKICVVAEYNFIAEWHIVDYILNISRLIYARFSIGIYLEQFSPRIKCNIYYLIYIKTEGVHVNSLNNKLKFNMLVMQP